ncbi:BamA/TamA family outer membrane protein [uncultured Prevotella sp.]|uniref:translocation and assembly module lipoprotein TamL n=1 Tax=uncultured Prevotella sp. TaxID=159272 RepID=UPI002631ECF1|nr:BamA/TamA family outer membrane protein [uncultured Prevotella sp.]
MKYISQIIPLLLAVLIVGSCSSTSSVPEGDQLYIGLKPIEYKEYEKNDHFYAVQEEVEAALATAPNGAFFGSSYHRTIPYKLWIWNNFSNSETKLGKWIAKTFGSAPVLMSWVNPELRTSVAQSVLRKHGYLGGTVSYMVEQQKNPKKAKIAYTVNMNELSTVDTLEYVNFPSLSDSLIRLHVDEARIKPGDPFDVSALDAERSRLSTLFRNNGFYYYQPSYASYLADTLAVPGKVHLRLQLADNIHAAASHKWYIGKMNVNIMKQSMEQLRDTFTYRRLTLAFNGKKPPIRARLLLRHLRLLPKQQFSYDAYMESADRLSNSGQYSSVQFAFTPQDTTALCDTLDMTVSCVLNKPYEAYVETNYSNKINGRTGPEIVVGFKKKNAFRGGEVIDLNLHGAYEWQTNGQGSDYNSYEYGTDLSVSFPRMIVPFLKPYRYYNTPTTTVRASTNVVKRPGYFKMHTASGDWTYKWQPTDRKKHEFSPLTIKYQHLTYATHKFDSIMYANPYLYATMQDIFIPKMIYSFTYTSPKKYRNPIYWNITASEAGNILSLGYMAAGKKWGDEGKEMFKNAYAQFFKIESDFTKTWATGLKSQLVGHINVGLVYSYGNMKATPYSEQFYVGGANSIRAFPVRSVGPGSYYTDEARLSYLDQTGDMKFLANLEYRFNLFGNLYGAAFIDAGNVWGLKDDGYRSGARFKLKNIAKEMALGTGVGVRYDLEFLILRLDWGVGLHMPYDTGKSGYYNIRRFKDSHSLHLAVGYPF